jgi:hypothetical protein
MMRTVSKFNGLYSKSLHGVSGYSDSGKNGPLGPRGNWGRRVEFPALRSHNLCPLGIACRAEGGRAFAEHPPLA